MVIGLSRTNLHVILWTKFYLRTSNRVSIVSLPVTDMLFYISLSENCTLSISLKILFTVLFVVLDDQNVTIFFSFSVFLQVDGVTQSVP